MNSEEKNNRPYIICHMTTSIDGKVTGDFLNTEIGSKSAEDYFEINRKLKCDGFICGRVTMETSFTNSFKPDLSKYENKEIPEGDFVAMKHNYYAISYDRHGNVGWTDSKIHDEDIGYNDCHIIEVVCEDTPKSYLAYLRDIGVSYILAGKSDLDLKLSLYKLYKLFNIKKLLLEGGSIINGVFEREDTVDELSLVIAPIIGDKKGLPLFYDSTISNWKLSHVEKLNNSVWLRYEK